MAKELNCLGFAANFKSRQQLEQDLNSRPPLTTWLRYIPPIGERGLFIIQMLRPSTEGYRSGSFQLTLLLRINLDVLTLVVVVVVNFINVSRNSSA